MFLIFDLDVEVYPPFRCITQHPSFQGVCLHIEVLEAAIVGVESSARDERETANCEGQQERKCLCCQGIDEPVNRIPGEYSLFKR